MKVIENNDFNEFVKNIKRVNAKRYRPKLNTVGLNGFSDYYKKIKPSGKRYRVSRKIYSSIIKDYISMLTDELIKEGQMTIPNLGRFVIKKEIKKPRFIDGKLEYNGFINWHETHKLWFEDKEAMANGTIIRNPPSPIYRISWIKPRSKDCWSSFFEFKTARPLKIKFRDYIRDNPDDIVVNK